MYKTIKVKAPAKINLTLEVLGKRDDGYHNIKSIMQAISLYDYLTFSAKKAEKTKILLSGSSSEIPYNEKNLVYKAIDAFLRETGILADVTVYIEKNIPVEAGLAGGSADGAAALYAMNKLFDEPLDNMTIERLCSTLGSDLNFCLHGGTALCMGRGEDTQKTETPMIDVTLIKPLGFGISAKEAYTKFSYLPQEKKTPKNYTEKIIKGFNKKYLYNSLEAAVIDDYPELAEIKTKLPESMMSGSGPTFFVLQKNIPAVFNPEKFLVIDGLTSVNSGIETVC